MPAPILASVAVVLQRGADFAATASDLARPVLVVCVLAAVVSAVVAATTRRAEWGAILAPPILMLLLGAGLPFAVFLGIALWWPVLSLERRLLHRGLVGPPHLPHRLATAFAVGLVLASTVAVSNTLLQPGTTTPVAIDDDGASGGPNVYVLLLDGYPRGDTLRSTFSYDNGPFEAELAELGFTTYADSLSNYTKTWLSLASAVNLQYLHSIIVEPPENAAGQLNFLHGLISDSALFRLLEDRGYETWVVASPFSSVVPDRVDHVLRLPHPTEFEIVLLQESLFTRLFPGAMATFAASEARAGIYDALDTLAELASLPSAEPRFVWAHALAPHAPFVLGSANVTERLSACFPLRCNFWDPTTEGTELTEEEYGRGLRQQLDALNHAVLDSLREVVAADPDSLIIVVSDHGARYSLDVSDEHFRNFLSVRTPDSSQLVDGDASLVNLFRYVAARYFGSRLTPLPYEAWLSDWEKPMNLTRVHGVR